MNSTINSHQNSLMQMNMMMTAQPMMNGMMNGMMISPFSFNFIGNSMSLQARLENMTPEQSQEYLEANITVTGI